MNKKGYFYLCISILLFSTLETASKFIVNDFNPIQLNFLRFFIGGIVLLPFTLFEMKKKHISLSVKDVVILISLGILAVPISMSFFQLSLLHINASVLAVIISANPVFVAPFSFFILKEHIDKAVGASLVLGILGIAVIAAPSLSMGNGIFPGIMLGIAASVTFALFSVLGKILNARLGGLVLNGFVFLSGSIVMLPFMILSKIPVFSGITFSNIPYLLYLGIVVTTLGYIFLFKGLALLPANRGSLVFFIKPFLAGSLAYLILKENISIYLIMGTVLILGGILTTIMNSGKKSEKAGFTV